MVPITNFIFSDDHKNMRSDLLYSDNKSNKFISPKKNRINFNNNNNNNNEFNPISYDQRKRIGGYPDLKQQQQFQQSQQQNNNNFQGRSLDRNTPQQTQTTTSSSYSKRKINNTTLNNNQQSQQSQENSQIVLRQYELNYQRLLKYKQFLDDKAKEESQRQIGVQELIVVSKKNPEDRIEIPPKYIKFSRERSEDSRNNRLNDSTLYNNSQFRQTTTSTSKTPQILQQSRIQSPTTPFKEHKFNQKNNNNIKVTFDSHLNMTNGRGFQQYENRKTPPQTQRYTIPRILIQTQQQQSKTLEEDAFSPNNNNNTRMNQFMPRIAPKKMFDEINHSLSPNKMSNNSRIISSSSKRNNQTVGIESIDNDYQSLISHKIHDTKQMNTVNISNNNNQISVNTFYKPKQQIQLDNFMKEIQEQSLGIKKSDLSHDNHSKIIKSSNQNNQNNPRTPSTYNNTNSASKQQDIEINGRQKKSVTPNLISSTNQQNFRINQINRPGLRDLVRPYSKQPNVVYEDKEYFTISKNNTPQSLNQKKLLFTKNNNNNINSSFDYIDETTQSQVNNNNSTGQQSTQEKQQQQQQNNTNQNNNSNILQQYETNTNNYNNINNEQQRMNQQNIIQDNRHIFSEKQFNLQIRESKIPLLKTLLNEENDRINNQSLFDQSNTFRNTRIKENYDPIYHEKKMEQNLKQSVIQSEYHLSQKQQQQSQQLQNGLNIAKIMSLNSNNNGYNNQNQKQSQFKDQKLNYGVLEISSLSSNFDLALQNVKMENLFMVEELLFDALKYCKESYKIKKTCKQYLKNINDENYKIIEGIFKDKRILMNYKRLIIYERIAILILLLFSHNTNSLQSSQSLSCDIQICLKNLCHYLHNNSTLLIELLLDIFSQTKQIHPNWEKLTEMFHLRLKKPNSADKNELVDLILQNNNQIDTLFEQLLKKYNYDFMITINNLKEEAIKFDHITDSLNILANTSQQILNQVSVTKKQQNNQNEQYQQDDEEEDQNRFQNIEEYIQHEKKNKIIVANDFQIDDDEEGEEDYDDYDIYDNIDQDNNNNHFVNSQQIYDNSIQQQVRDIQNNIINQNDNNQQNTNPQQKRNIKIKTPFLQPINKKYKYTLVLDLDETLVHYHEMEDQSGGEFLVRPYAEQFLKEMSEYYEIVIFTAAVKEYADWILDVIDSDKNRKNISYRLYRQHTIFNGSYNIKDLDKLGRNIEKIIIIDNLPENFQRQPENGIFIQSWFGEKNDKALYDLAPLLKQIVEKDYPDVRGALKKFSDQIEENVKNGVQYPHLNLQL